MPPPKKVKQKKEEVPSKAAADNFPKEEGNAGSLTKPPKDLFPTQAQGLDTVSSDPVKTELQAEYNRLIGFGNWRSFFSGFFIKTAGNEVIFDGLAAYIASKTKPRRLSKKGGGTKYEVSDDSLKLSGNKEAMEFLHKIGYWKDKPRRIAKAAKDLYSEWSEDKDSEGNRTRSLSENGEKDNLTKGKRKKKADDDSSTSNLSDIIGLIRPDEETRKEENTARTEKDKDDKYSVAGNKDGILKKVRSGDFAWSAATISYIHHKAGSGDTFAYSEGHVSYAKASKGNNNKDHIEGLEKLHHAIGKDAVSVQLGDTLHRSRNSQSTFNKINSKTHSDVVVGFKIYKIETSKKKKKSIKTYTEVDRATVQKEFDEAKALDEGLTLDSFYKKKGYQLYAEVIGGNTSDFKDPGTKTEGGEGGTVGKNFIPLNPDLTIKEKAGRNNKAYAAKDAYFGVQRTDYDYSKEEDE